MALVRPGVCRMAAMEFEKLPGCCPVNPEMLSMRLGPTRSSAASEQPAARAMSASPSRSRALAWSIPKRMRNQLSQT